MPRQRTTPDPPPAPKTPDGATAWQTPEQIAVRLENGYTRIEQARTRGENVDSWEVFWLSLLEQYQQAARSAGAPYYTP